MRVVVRRWKSHTGYALGMVRFRLCFLFVFIVMLLAACAVVFEIKILPYILAMAEDQAETSVVMMVDSVISECDELNSLEYGDIIDVSRGADGEPVSVSAKTVVLNKIRTELSVNMNKKLDEFYETEITVPFGGLIGLRFLAGWGIRIPVRFVPYGTAYAEFESSVEGYDINRTYHKIYIEASATINIFVPTKRETLTVNTKVPIAETIIAGEVPESYLNIDGLVNNEGTN